MGKMKAKLYIIIFIIAFISTGCHSANEIIVDFLLDKSGITEDENYKTYQELKNKEQLDQDGYFTDNQDELENQKQNHDGEIHITFSRNNNLSVTYYMDPEKSICIDSQSCYVKPGDSIYAKLSVDDQVKNKNYEFSEFKIMEYSEDGINDVSKKLYSNYKENEIVLSIPKDYKGSELSVIPEGKYTEREIPLYDYYKDDDGNEHKLFGKWTINEKEYDGDSAIISSVIPYIVSYHYDKDKYFFVSSSEEVFYNDEIEGEIIFKQREATYETPNYSVELHELKKVTLTSAVEREVKINNEKLDTIYANSSKTIEKLKYGDIVKIYTNKKWEELENCRDFVMDGDMITHDNPENSYENYEYNLLVPEKDGEFIFNPLDYHYEHGKIIFKCYGSQVTTTQHLAKKSRIYYEGIGDDGYFLPINGEGYIIVEDEENTKKQLKALKFQAANKVKIYLEQPNTGGTIKYFIDDTEGKREIKTNEIVTTSGSKINIKFDPWPGWLLNTNENISDNLTYVVNENLSEQLIPFDVLLGSDKNHTYDINDIFIENPHHKPSLKVITLEESIGEKAIFTITINGYESREFSYEDERLGIMAVKVGSSDKNIDPKELFGFSSGNNNVVNNGNIINHPKLNGFKIGTDKGILMLVNKFSVNPGKAIKIGIEKTDNSGIVYYDYKYIDDFIYNKYNGKIPIEIYTENEKSQFHTWYDSISLYISLVDIMKFTSLDITNNLEMTIVHKNTGEPLEENELIEPDEEVEISIKPKNGYYIYGENVSADGYKETMTYFDYSTRIQSILDNLVPIKPYTVSLDESDLFAKYEYRKNGELVSGNIQVYAGDIISLFYEITNPAYELKEGSGGFIFGIGSSYNSVTKDITINADFNKSIIRKEDFGIEVIKK